MANSLFWFFDVAGEVLAHSDRKYPCKVVTDLPKSAKRTVASRNAGLVDVIVLSPSGNELSLFGQTTLNLPTILLIFSARPDNSSEL